VLPPPAPTVSISFTPSAVQIGQSFQAAWNATNAASCTLTGGVPNGTWGASSQTSAVSGADAEVVQAAGQYTFTATCTSIDPNTAAGTGQATLTVSAATTAAATGGGKSGGGGGGGGSVDVLDLLLLAALNWRRRARPSST
jgi:hypothetical protein